jgi:hypothetical protein
MVRMQRRDCGCGPTLEQLLAASGGVPIIRAREAPRARVGASMNGWLQWQLVDRRGREVRAGEQSNLILDQGLDGVAEHAILERVTSSSGARFPIIRYAAVGTSSASPEVTDVGLGSELARVDTLFATNALTRPGDGVYRLTIFIEFDYAAANGNLTEWGFSWSESPGSNLFNRELFRDDEGDPETVTKTSDEKLRLTYALEVSLSPTAFTAGWFELGGVGTVNGQYRLLRGAEPTSVSTSGRAADLMLFSRLAGGVSNPGVIGDCHASSTDASAWTYEQNPSLSTATRSSLGLLDRDAYVPGSFERSGGRWWWDTDRGNNDPVRSLILVGTHDTLAVTTIHAGYVFAIDSGDFFAKDDEHTLEVGVPTVTWGRAGS